MTTSKYNVKSWDPALVSLSQNYRVTNVLTGAVTQASGHSLAEEGMSLAVKSNETALLHLDRLN